MKAEDPLRGEGRKEGYQKERPRAAPSGEMERKTHGDEASMETSQWNHACAFWVCEVKNNTFFYNQGIYFKAQVLCGGLN